jgi:hypothetical protein
MNREIYYSPMVPSLRESKADRNRRFEVMGGVNNREHECSKDCSSAPTRYHNVYSPLKVGWTLYTLKKGV